MHSLVVCVVKTLMALCFFKWFWVFCWRVFLCLALLAASSQIWVTMSSCIQTVMGCCVYFEIPFLVTLYFQSHGCGFIFVVFPSMYLRSGYRVAIMPICILYGGLVIQVMPRASIPMKLLSIDSFFDLYEGYASVFSGYLLLSVGICFSSTSLSYPT
jgi:hypothetical protein